MTKLTLPDSFQESKPKLSKPRPTGFRWLSPQFDATSTPVAWQWLLGHDLVGYPNLVCCPLHDQERPQVLLVHKPKQLPALLCYNSRQHGLPDKLPFTANIAEVYYRMTTLAEPDKTDYLPRASQHMWATRLLLRAELVNPDQYQLWPRNPERLRTHLETQGAKLSKRRDWTITGAQGISDVNLVTVYRAVREMGICKGLLHQENELSLARRFVARWAGLNIAVAHRGLQMLRVVGLLDTIATSGHTLRPTLFGSKLLKPKSHRPINVFRIHPLP